VDYDFSASTGYWITLASHTYQQKIDEELRPFGITFRQFQVIGWLKYEGSLTQSELARRLMIEPPSLAGILSRMESMNWIERTACPEDRRKKYLAIGSNAEPVWEQIVNVLQSLRTTATAGLTDDEVQLLHNMLGRVLENMGGTTPFPIPAPTAIEES